MILEDKKALLACIGGSIVTYNVSHSSIFPSIPNLHAFRLLISYLHSQRPEWIPIGTVKHLWMYPIKSGRRKEVRIVLK